MHRLCTFIILCLISGTGFAKNLWNRNFDLVADVRLGTLGYGAGIAWELNDTFDLRLGGHTMSFSYGTNVNALDYDIDAQFRSTSIHLSWFPARKNFHINGGIFNTSHTVDIALSGQTSYFINGNEYSSDFVGNVTTSLTFGSPAYYFGVGWDTVFERFKDFGLNFDIGVIYQGVPSVNFSADGAGASDQGFQDDLDKEEQDLESALELFRFYPAISLGLTYRFSFP